MVPMLLILHFPTSRRQRGIVILLVWISLLSDTLAQGGGQETPIDPRQSQLRSRRSNIRDKQREAAYRYSIWNKPRSIGEPPDERNRTRSSISYSPLQTSFSQKDPAFLKCYRALQEAAQDDKLRLQDYTEFLSILSDGTMVYDHFGEVPAALVLTYYTTACSIRRCSHNRPYVSLQTTGSSMGLLQFFCREVMMFAMTEASVESAYTIRYDNSTITEEEVKWCLSTATNNLLLDHFGCLGEGASDSDTPSSHRKRTRRRIKSSSRVRSSDDAGKDNSLGFMIGRNTNHNNEPPEKDLYAEREKSLARIRDSVRDDSSDYDSSDDRRDGGDGCRYNVTTAIRNIVPFPCLLSPFTESSSNSIASSPLCNLVLSTTTVTAPQIVEPSQEELQQEVTATLRSAINQRSFIDYLPEDCLT